MTESKMRLTEAQISSFNTDGYLVVKQWLNPDALTRNQQLAQQQLEQATIPWEREAQLGYPGAPKDVDELGGHTIRRLLGAYARESAWRDLATADPIKGYLQQLFNDNVIYLSQAHHNCLMTKSPRYSSDTGWHQDRRYWYFKKPDLISAWLALGKETLQNGVLQVIPGSHRELFSPQQFDERSFFVADIPINKSVIKRAKILELEPGDLLFFHCNLLHCASRNTTDTVKLSLVFTYHKSDNKPLAGTRSSTMEEIAL